MTTADQETVRRMQATRRVEWGHWGLTFAEGTRVVATLPFSCVQEGPDAGFVVSSDQQEVHRAAGRAWVARGELPEGSVRPGAMPT